LAEKQVRHGIAQVNAEDKSTEKMGLFGNTFYLYGYEPKNANRA
jgi:hypothetical protein